MKTQQYDALVIGGGHNGLVCAFYLAKQGLKTCVVERSAEVGGATVTEEFYPGFKNSVASYTVSLLQPKIIADMQLEQHGLQVVLRKVDNFLPTESGYLLAGRDGLTHREIARYSAKDALAYDEYSRHLNDVVDCLRQWLLICPPNAGGGLSDVLALLKMGNRLRGTSLETQRNLLNFFSRSAGEILDGYFDSDIVKALFGFDSVVGHFASPYEPGTAYVLLHHVFGEAAGAREAWGHAIGGMGSITQAMKKACLAAGVEIKTNSRVTKVRVEQQRVAGVETEGQIISSKRVASAIHPQLLYLNLLQEADLPTEFIKRIKLYKSHSGTFRMNVALDRLPQFIHKPSSDDFLTSGIIIAPSLAYMDQAWSSAKQHGWSTQPIIEMLIPSTLDDSLTPPGKHVASLFCQQFSYTLPERMHWPQQRDTAADHIINTVNQYAPGFTDSILGRQVLSPYDLEQKFALVGGDIFHGRMSLDQLFSARPILGNGNYRSPIKGLYMCGSGTHPGGGVTGAPGHNAAQQIIKDWRWRG